MNIFQALELYIVAHLTLKANQLKAADHALRLSNGTLESGFNALVPGAVATVVGHEAQVIVSQSPQLSNVASMTNMALGGDPVPPLQ